MGFIIQFYIIFGTYLLTQGPVQIAGFFLFQCFTENEYQSESKRNETFGRVIFGTVSTQKTWSTREGKKEVATRVQGAPPPPRRAPTLVGSLWLPRCPPSSYIYPRTLKTSRQQRKP